MDRWTLITMLVFGGLGTIAFLRVVCNEIALQLRAMNIRMEREARDRALAKTIEPEEETSVQAESTAPRDAQAA